MASKASTDVVVFDLTLDDADDSKQVRPERIHHDSKQVSSERRVPLEASLEERKFSKGKLSQVNQTKVSSFFKATPKASTAFSSSTTTSLSMSIESPLPPGVVLIRSFMNMDEQNKVVKVVDELHERTPLYVQDYGSGSLKFFISSFGLHWSQLGYSLKRDDFDKVDVLPIPGLFADISSRAFSKNGPKPIQDAVNAGLLPYCPAFSSGLCNFYPCPADMPEGFKSHGGVVKLGNHRDDRETKEALDAGLPVLSLSLGDSADFNLYPTVKEWGDKLQAHLNFKKNKDGKGKGKEGADGGGGGGEYSESALQCKVKLNSGDLLLFGGPARRILHGITTFYKDTRPDGINMRSGRLNVTMRCDPWQLEKLKGRVEANQLRARLAEKPPWPMKIMKRERQKQEELREVKEPEEENLESDKKVKSKRSR